MTEINSRIVKITSLILRCESWIEVISLNRRCKKLLLFSSRMAFVLCGKNAFKPKVSLC
jgi:hypothetical protein